MNRMHFGFCYLPWCADCARWTRKLQGQQKIFLIKISLYDEKATCWNNCKVQLGDGDCHPLWIRHWSTLLHQNCGVEFGDLAEVVRAVISLVDMIFVSVFLMRSADRRAAGSLYQHSLMMLDMAPIIYTKLSITPWPPLHASSAPSTRTFN